MTRVTGRICACGHPRDTHEHFRPGSDCGECGPQLCPSYRPDPAARRSFRDILQGLLGRGRPASSGPEGPLRSVEPRGA